jgi:hypothetical protein
MFMPMKEEVLFQEQFHSEWDDVIQTWIDDSVESSKSFHDKTISLEALSRRANFLFLGN